MTQFVKHDDLQGASRFVAAICAWMIRPGRGPLPDPSEPTATVTFVRFDGRVYALTAKHVPEELDLVTAKSGQLKGSYFCPAHQGAIVSGPFIVPPPLFPHRQPDVALRRVSETTLERLGKEAFEILPTAEMPWPVTHGMAFGFPTVDKKAITDAGGERLSMPSVEAVAECVSTSNDSDQIQYHSALPNPLERGSLSGLSGGAVFWSTGTHYGLAGIVKEALDVNPNEVEFGFYDTPKVNFICQRVDYSSMARWVEFYETNWQLERDKLNQKAREEKALEVQEQLDGSLGLYGDTPA